MATTNITIDADWTKLAESGETSLLITTGSQYWIEYATTAADAAPAGIVGHLLRNSRGEPPLAITRDVIGSGYVWARVHSGLASGETVTMVVTE
jgi:hypothetical protein